MIGAAGVGLLVLIGVPAIWCSYELLRLAMVARGQRK